MLKKELVQQFEQTQKAMIKRLNALSKYKYNQGNAIELYLKDNLKSLSKIKKLNKSNLQFEIFNMKRLLNDNLFKLSYIQKERKKVIKSVNTYTRNDTLNFRNVKKFIDYYDSTFDSETSDWYEFIDGWIMENEL